MFGVVSDVVVIKMAKVTGESHDYTLEISCGAFYYESTLTQRPHVTQGIGRVCSHQYAKNSASWHLPSIEALVEFLQDHNWIKGFGRACFGYGDSKSFHHSLLRYLDKARYFLTMERVPTRDSPEKESSRVVQADYWHGSARISTAMNLAICETTRLIPTRLLKARAVIGSRLTKNLLGIVTQFFGEDPPQAVQGKSVVIVIGDTSVVYPKGSEKPSA